MNRRVSSIANPMPTTLVGAPSQIRAEIRRIVKDRIAARGRLPRSPRILFPAPAMRAYRAELLKYVHSLKVLAKEGLGQWAKAHARDLERALARHDSVLKDAADDLFDGFQKDLNWTKVQFGKRWSQEELARIAQRTAKDVSVWNALQEKNAIGKVLGVDVVMSEPWLALEMQTFVGENVMLIESIEERFFKEVSAGFYNSFRLGIRAEDIAPFLDDLIDEGASHAANNAERIARDQIGSLNSKLSERRQTSLGIQGYYWRGVLDQREREEHVEREGEYFSWDNPPPDGHPGMPIMCRCIAEPAFDEGEDESS